MHRSYVGNMFTSLEMAGVTLTLMKLDNELVKCIDYPVETPALVQI